jgi:hypothetical protein
MASFKKFDAVATVGKYTDKQGNEKKRYVNVGSVFEDEQGRLSLKLDAVPAGSEWSGWVSFYEPKAKESAPVENSAQQTPIDDDAPF